MQERIRCRSFYTTKAKEPNNLGKIELRRQPQTHKSIENGQVSL